MRKIAIWMLAATLATGAVRAQDAGTQQQIDKLAGQMQDIIEAQAAQNKQLATLEQEISALRDKINTPVVNNSASVEDLQKLADKLREIDGKRQDDKELILKNMGELKNFVAKTLAETASTPPPTPHNNHHTTPPPKDSGDETATPETTTQKSYEYKVQEGDSLTAIIKAYRAKGVKVTLSQVLKANPGLNANTLYAGKTIVIPDASGK